MNTPSMTAARLHRGVRETFIALQHPNYRLWFIGQLISLVGTWMQATAQGYLIFDLTHSPVYLGYVGFATGLPTLLLTPFGGILADRIPRRTLLIITQSYMMLLAFILAGLVFTGLIQPWHIILMAFFLGIGNSFDAPARQSFVVELVGREDLANAIAINSSMFTTANAVGPAVAGLAYAALGPAWCFSLNGISFLAVITALSFMRLKLILPSTARRSSFKALGEAVQFITQKRVIILLITTIGMLSMFGMSLMTLMPAWAVDVLQGDVKTNGWLLSARGVGALVGALMVASLSKSALRGKLWALGNMLLPVLMLLFSFMRVVPFSLAVLCLVGWAFMIVANTTNALVQLMVPDEIRGRVMGLYVLVFFGSSTLGTLTLGSLAQGVSAPFAVWIACGALITYFAFIWIKFPEVRLLK